MGGERGPTVDGSDASGSIRVLHVDDDPAVTGLVKDYLEYHDPRLEIVSSNAATEGLAALDAEAFDCVVSDFKMPEMDGIEFLGQVRETDPHLPFILFTGRGSEVVASEAISAGVTDYLQKGGPERLELLSNRIHHAVERYHLTVELEAEATKFRAVFERASDAMVLADSEGRYVDANPEACALFGVEKAELLGRTAADFAPAEFDFAAAWRSFLDSDRERGRFPLLRPDGTRRQVEYSATPHIVDDLSLSILRPVPTNERTSTR